MELTVAKQPLIERLLRLRGSSQEKLGQVVRISLILFAITAVLFIVSSAVTAYRTSNYLVEVGNLAVAARDIDRGILEMRRNEKDFFMRQNVEDLETHDANFKRTIEAFDRLKANPRLTADDLAKFDKAEKEIKQYKTFFQQAVDDLKIKGLKAQGGLNKNLRETSIVLNDLIVKTGNLNLQLALTNLRGHSRDFVIFENKELVDRYDKEAQNFLEAIASSGVDGAVKAQISEAAKKYFDAFHAFAQKTFDAAKSTELARVQARDAQVPIPPFIEETVARRTEQFNILLGIIGLTALGLLALFAGLGYMLRNAQKGADAGYAETLEAQQKAEAENDRLNNSVISILQAVDQLSQRDLTAKAPVTEDIIGTVSDSINALSGETARVLHGVNTIAGEVSQVSTNVKSQADKVAETAEGERQSVQQMVESLLDATQSMNRVAALTEQSNMSAAQATEATESALSTVNDTVKGMDSIRETIAETEKRIKRLGERSQEITGIVNLINTISERTHVLALNASMQAAVAGEAGRGFAVVAEEVQRLAESSRNATQQIGTLVSNIQLETNETINTVNKTIGQVVEGSAQAQKAGEQMRRTQEITEQLVSQVRRISEASEQQKAMSANLLESVQRIGDSTEMTARQIEAQNKETDSLQSAAARLVESVSVFKLPPQAAA